MATGQGGSKGCSFVFLLGACFESLALVPSGKKPAVPLRAKAGDWKEANGCLEG